MDCPIDLDPEQLRLYGGKVDFTHITLREATPQEASSLTPSTPDSILLYKSYINAGLTIPLNPLLRAILSWFDIAPCQVNPNFYRIISVASAAIPYLRRDLVLTPELFINCYKLNTKRRLAKRRLDNGDLATVYLSQRYFDVTPPGGTIPKSSTEKKWMQYPLVATGPWQGPDEGPAIRSFPNPEMDPVKPLPLLWGNDATAFNLLRRGGNDKFKKFLEMAHRWGKSKPHNVGEGETEASTMTAMQKHKQASSKRRKLAVLSSDSEGSANQPTVLKTPRLATVLVQRPRISLASHPEARPARRPHSKPSPTPPKSPAQASTNLSGLQAVTDTIPVVLPNPNGTLECPETTTGSSGEFCLPRDIELEGGDVDGLISTGAIFMSRATTLLQMGAKRLRESQKSASSAEGLKEENKQLKAEVERLKKRCFELQSSIEKLEGIIASSVKEAVLLAEQSANNNVKLARMAGYDDGLIDGRRMGWTEFAELQQRVSSEPVRPI